MDVAWLIFTAVTAEPGEALHTHVPLFRDSMDASSVVLSALADWLADSIFDEQEPAGPPGGRSWQHVVSEVSVDVLGFSQD